MFHIESLIGIIVYAQSREKKIEVICSSISFDDLLTYIPLQIEADVHKDGIGTEKCMAH